MNGGELRNTESVVPDLWTTEFNYVIKFIWQNIQLDTLTVKKLGPYGTTSNLCGGIPPLILSTFS